MKVKINLIGFDYYDADAVAEISRNVSTLVATPEGTCAGDRNYGINLDFVGLPAMAAANQLTLELAEKIPLYEPRADIIGSSCRYNLSNDPTDEVQGDLIASIRIGVNPNYNIYADEDSGEV